MLIIKTESLIPIIKNECLDIENDVEATGVIDEPENDVEKTGLKHEPVEGIKCEEIYIKHELDSEEGEPVPETEDCNSSGRNATSETKNQIKRYASKEEQLHFCPDCTYSSRWKQNLQRHRRVHSDRHLDRQSSDEKRKFKCHYCDFRCNDNSNLKKHISAIHEREKVTLYACEQCPYKSVRTSSLRRHLKLHGERVSPYKCPSCERGFSEKRALDDHFLRKHDSLQHLIASRIFECKFCTYKSTRPTNVRTHVTLKHDQKNAEKFRCHNCNYSTLRKSNLIQHLVIHSNSSLHQCPSCKKGFNQKRDLDSHILYNHKDNAVMLKTITRNIHECTLCNFKTVHKTALGHHIKANHK